MPVTIENDRINILSPVMRAVYMNATEARVNPNSPDKKKRFGVTLLAPPNEWVWLWEAICAMADHRFPSENMADANGNVIQVKGSSVVGRTIYSPLRVGQDMLLKDPKKHAIFQGMNFAAFPANFIPERPNGNRPILLNYDGTEITDMAMAATLFYSGAHVRIFGNVYAYPKPGQTGIDKGIGLGVNGIQFAKHDTKLGGDPSARVKAAFASAPALQAPAGPPLTMPSQFAQPTGQPAPAPAVQQGGFAAPAGQPSPMPGQGAQTFAPTYPAPAPAQVPAGTMPGLPGMPG